MWICCHDLWFSIFIQPGLVKLQQTRFCSALCRAWVRLCKEWVIKKKRRMKCRRCIENASSYSLICKTAHWHLPDSRAVDKNRALTLLWISTARVCPVLLVLSSLFHFSPPPPAQPTSLLKSSPSLCRSSWSAALQVGGIVLCETCLINEDPDLCYRWGGGSWSSTEAKSLPLIVLHLRANKRPRSLISLEMDYYPFCILLHPSRVFFPLSLPLLVNFPYLGWIKYFYFIL